MTEKYKEDNEIEEQYRPEAEGINLTAYAIIKYTAIVIIVLAILYFIAVYILPLVREAIR